MTNELINTERKVDGKFTFLRNIILVGDDKEYQVIEDVIYEGSKELFVNYTVTAKDLSADFPEISYNRNKNCFTICCWYRSDLTPNEFEKYLKTQQQGLAVAEFLTREFCINHTKEEDDNHETR